MSEPSVDSPAPIGGLPAPITRMPCDRPVPTLGRSAVVLPIAWDGVGAGAHSLGSDHVLSRPDGTPSAGPTVVADHRFLPGLANPFPGYGGQDQNVKMAMNGVNQWTSSTVIAQPVSLPFDVEYLAVVSPPVQGSTSTQVEEHSPLKRQVSARCGTDHMARSSFLRHTITFATQGSNYIASNPPLLASASSTCTFLASLMEIFHLQPGWTPLIDPHFDPFLGLAQLTVAERRAILDSLMSSNQPRGQSAIASKFCKFWGYCSGLSSPESPIPATQSWVLVYVNWLE